MIQLSRIRMPFGDSVCRSWLWIYISWRHEQGLNINFELYYIVICIQVSQLWALQVYSLTISLDACLFFDTDWYCLDKIDSFAPSIVWCGLELWKGLSSMSGTLCLWTATSLAEGTGATLGSHIWCWAALILSFLLSIPVNSIHWTDIWILGGRRKWCRLQWTSKF